MNDSKLLSELLAIIHGDGGHYQEEHGTEKAVGDAMAKWYERAAPAGVEGMTSREAFEAGWCTAANWMNRGDLIADIGSPAYMADMTAALAAAPKAPAAAQEVSDEKIFEVARNNGMFGFEDRFTKAFLRTVRAVAALAPQPPSAPKEP